MTAAEAVAENIQMENPMSINRYLNSSIAGLRNLPTETPVKENFSPLQTPIQTITNGVGHCPQQSSNIKLRDFSRISWISFQPVFIAQGGCCGYRLCTLLTDDSKPQAIKIQNK